MKRSHKHIVTAAILLAIFLTDGLINAQVILDQPPELSGIDVEEHLGDYVPLDLTFTDASGSDVTLGDYFNKGKPVFLVLAYYECPMLCTLVLSAVANGAIQVTSLDPGTDYEMVTVSIDPGETAETAAQKQSRYIKSLGSKGSEGSWHFLVGNEENIRSIADVVGFKYYYVPERDEYAHPAVAFILAEDGKISRYLYGLDFKPRDLRLGLLEAAEGKIGSTVDKIILYCFHYDPDAKGYVLFAQNVMRTGGVLTLIALALFLSSLWTKEKFRKSRDEVVANMDIKENVEV